jgi:DNA-binding GntR family transcriptional regulator
MTSYDNMRDRTASLQVGGHLPSAPVAWTSRADRIDRDGPDLLYRQMADDIADMVKSGELPRGSRLPAEHELMDIYAVSRPTVRSAVAELSKAGVVTVVRGRGTYVKR